jgi:hypothetical protein
MKKAILSSEIDLRLQPSYFLWGWWCLFSMLVMACLCWKLPFGWALCGIGLYCVVSGWQWTQLVATSWKQSIQTMRVDVFGHMTITNRAGQRYEASVLADSVVHPWCLVLHLHLRAMDEDSPTEACVRNQRILLLPDQVNKRHLKAFRVWLRWGQV